MSTFVGKVDRIDSTTRHSKKTGKPFKTYDATMEDGSVLSLGFSDCGLKRGDNIEAEADFEYGKMQLIGKPTVNGDSSMATTSVKTASGGPKQAYSGGGKPFPVPNTHGDTSIIRQNALTNANTTVANWYTLSGNAYPDTVEEYAEQVIKTAYKLAEFSTGQREARIAKAMAGAADE